MPIHVKNSLIFQAKAAKSRPITTAATFSPSKCVKRNNNNKLDSTTEVKPCLGIISVRLVIYR
jgi:hypothetical protein